MAFLQQKSARYLTKSTRLLDHFCVILLMKKHTFCYMHIELHHSFIHSFIFKMYLKPNRNILTYKISIFMEDTKMLFIALLCTLRYNPEKMCNLGELHCLPQIIKSTIFLIFSNGAPLKQSGMRSVYFKKNVEKPLILASKVLIAEYFYLSLNFSPEDTSYSLQSP